MSLSDLGWDRHADVPQPDPSPPPSRPARVVLQAPGVWRVHDGDHELLARLRASMPEPPVSGDWVLVSGSDDDARIEALLPRRTALARAVAGKRRERQVLAANIDLVGVCAPADDVNLRRVERELTAVWESGAVPLLLLTKCDLSDDLEPVVAAASAVAVGVDVVPVSAVSPDGVRALIPYLADGATLALIGPSGVGKSSLVNRLAGSAVLPTREIRADGKGRHTTTGRHLVLLPSGGLLLDTPGMREFAPWADQEALSSSFADIDELAADCRFSDCRHESEPGCAVLAAAMTDPGVDARLASWRALQRELAWLARRNDARLMAAERRRWAAITRSARGRIRP